MTPETEQELAHTLLVELLAYQFASPVRWIETQDVILADQLTERIVEVGPADTLGGMAKRTLASKYEAYDAAKSLQRQILCYNKDAKEIYYDVDPVVEEAAPVGGDDTAPASSSAPAAAAPVAASAPPPPSSGPAAAVADVSVQAVDIVRSLIAQKLKKPLSEIPLSKAIKDLVGGEHAPLETLATALKNLQASPPFRMRSSEILAKNLGQHQKNQRILPLTSLERPCKQLSMASLESSRLRWWLDLSHLRCLVDSTSPQLGSTWRRGGGWAPDDKTVSCFLL